MNRPITCETPIEEFTDFLIKNNLNAHKEFISSVLVNFTKVGEIYNLSEKQLNSIKGIGRDYIVKIGALFILKDLENFYATNLYNSLAKRKRYDDRYIIKKLLYSMELDTIFDEWTQHSESFSKYAPSNWPFEALADFIYDIKYSYQQRTPIKKITSNGKTITLIPKKKLEDVKKSWFEKLSKQRQVDNQHNLSTNNPKQLDDKCIEKNTSKAPILNNIISASESTKISFNNRLIHKMQMDIMDKLDTANQLPKITLSKRKVKNLTDERILAAIRGGLIDITALNDSDFIKKYELKLFTYVIKSTKLSKQKKYDLIKFIQNPDSYIQ